MRRSVLGVIAICVAAFLWALEGIVFTPKLYNLDVGFVVFIIHLITFALLNLIMIKEYKRIREFNKSDVLYLTLIALTGGVIGSLAIVKALFLVNFQQLSVVVLLQQLQPIFAIFLAMILLKEKATPKFYVWAGIAFVASYFLIFGLNGPNFNTGPMTGLAALFSLIAAMSWGSATVFGRKIATKYNFKTISFYRAGITTLIMFMYMLTFNKWGQFGVITAQNWIIAGLVAISSGLASMFIYYFGLKRVKAMVATLCELTFPLSAVILDYTINGTVLTAVQGISAIIMIISITRISMIQKDETVQTVRE